MTLDREQLERFSNERAKAVHVSASVSLCRVLGKYKLYVDANDDSIAPCLLMDGVWEAWITVALLSVARPGMTVVNVGANVGYYAILLGDIVGADGKVYAFEPQELLASLIRKSSRANGLYDRVDVQPWAIGDSDKEEVLLLCARGQNGYTFVQDTQEAHHIVRDKSAMRARQVTLDTVLPFGKPIDLLIMDCEGSEERVWDGMQAVLDRSPNLQVLLEFTPMFLADPMRFAKKLLSRGHQMFEIDTNGGFVEITPEELCVRYQTNIALLK
jgi:FkbM family methyltransferase